MTSYNPEPWDHDKAERELSKHEAELLTPHGPTEVMFGGLTVSWRRSTLRGGARLRRGRAYAKLVYTRTRRPGGRWVAEPISRAEALAELMKPWPLRRAAWDLENVLICHLCGAAGMGDEERQHWERVAATYPAGIKRGPGLTFVQEGVVVGHSPGSLAPTYEREWFDLCDACVRLIHQQRVRVLAPDE